MSSRQTKIGLGLILTLAVILRMAAILNYGHFWDDEMFSFIYSQKPWLDSLKFWLWETNPPLHLLILKLWFYVFPSTEFFARLPSLLAGVLNVYFIFVLGKKMFNEKIGLLSALLLALWPYHIFLSATARGYAFLLLFALLSVNFFHDIFILNQTTVKKYFWFGLFNLLLLYTHLTGLAIILTPAVFILIFKRKDLKLWLKINLLPALLWLVWAVPSFYSKTGAATLNNAWFLNLSQGPLDIIRSLNPLFGGPSWWPYSLILIILILTGAIIVFLKQTKLKTINTNFVFTNLLIWLPLLGAGIFGLWNIKFFVITLPFLVLLVAYLLNQHLRSVFLTILLTITICLPGLYGLNQILPVQNWDTVNNYLRSKTNNQKQVLIYNNFILKPQFDRYYQSPIPTLTYYPYQGDWDYNYISKNYLRWQHPSAEIKKWLMENNIEANQSRVLGIFLLEEANLGVDISKILKQAGWILKDSFKPRLLGKRIIYHYVKP